MASKKVAAKGKKVAKSRQSRSKRTTQSSGHPKSDELVILTGMSGSGKLSALKAFEDLGYYSVDNLPLELIPRFADLVRQSSEIDRAALVVDVREGMNLERFPAILRKVRQVIPTCVVFLEASEDALVRRFSETRRPHPMGREETVVHGIRAEKNRDISRSQEPLNSDSFRLKPFSTDITRRCNSASFTTARATTRAAICARNHIASY